MSTRRRAACWGVIHTHKTDEEILHISREAEQALNPTTCRRKRTWNGHPTCQSHIILGICRWSNREFEGLSLRSLWNTLVSWPCFSCFQGPTGFYTGFWYLFAGGRLVFCIVTLGIGQVLRFRVAGFRIIGFTGFSGLGFERWLTTIPERRSPSPKPAPNTKPCNPLNPKP